MQLKILSQDFLDQFKAAIPAGIDTRLEVLRQEKTPVDYFAFYHSVSSVFSSKIEGENIDYDSYFKHKFLHVPYQPDYTKKADDLFAAYEFIFKHELTREHVRIAHQILSANLLPALQQGVFRNNPMFVINDEGKIEYVAADAAIVSHEMQMLFADIQVLLYHPLTAIEVFFYAVWVHLVFVKIHPFQDGNGRTARLLEKWFLVSKLGAKAAAITLEKNYYNHQQDYYRNLRTLGLEYDTLNYQKALPFLLMTIQSVFH